jgi:RNA polymerase sigma factor (sigma-70 family)
MTEDELARLFREYGYIVFRSCILYLGDPRAAQDAVLEVFVRALDGAADLRNASDPRMWLCRLADQFCIDVLRLQKRNPDQNAPRLDTHVELAIQAAVGDDDREALLAVRRMLEGLDTESLRLAVLYYVDELTEEELSHELGLSRRTINKRLQLLIDHAQTLLRRDAS